MSDFQAFLIISAIWSSSGQKHGPFIGFIFAILAAACLVAEGLSK